ncbi:hypothetical protein [Palleronia rufa]|uniref:hypothetical protein n=1 Tax=Palleronia rufa TaxID=1530186 RepID=UPI0039F04B45
MRNKVVRASRRVTGVMLQFTDAAGGTIAVSDPGWQCLAVHTAPLDKACESVADAVAGRGRLHLRHLRRPGRLGHRRFRRLRLVPGRCPHCDVDPKLGYDEINESDSAAFIWGPDPEQSDTVPCRLTLD